MSSVRWPIVLLAMLVFGWGDAAHAVRCFDAPGDAAAVAATRDAITIGCPCLGAASHGDYMRCARTIVRASVTAGGLPAVCRRNVIQCAAKSTCGRADRVTCCLTRNGVTKCRTNRTAVRCIADGGCVGAVPSCCDACGAGGCVVPTTTTVPTTSSTSSSTTSTSTTSTSTSTMPANCGDGTCEAPKTCENCPADCGACVTGVPSLPIAVARCALPASCCGSECGLPTLTLSATSSAMAWTAFTGAISTPAIRVYLNRLPCSTIAPTPFPTLIVGTSISLTNGVTGTAQNNPWNLLRCLQENQIDGGKFILPVVDTGTACTSVPSSAPVAGFVGIDLLSVATGGATNSATLQILWRPDLAQPWDACP